MLAAYCYAIGLVVVPLVCWLLWRWNYIRYVAPVISRCSKVNYKMPLGQLGLPFFGEMLIFLWYFKILRQPDDFINTKRLKYGDNVGFYRTHLFGSPSIVVYSPSVCKFVLHSSERFKQEWPTIEALGSNSVITLQGERHTLLKNFLVNALNHRDSLTRTVEQVQPSVVAALESWSKKGKFIAKDELRKATLEYIGKYFAHLELDPHKIDALDKAFVGIIQGFRAQPWNFPGTAYHYAIKCRKKVIKILREELEKRKADADSAEAKSNDLMGRLMQTKDKEGKYLEDEEVLQNLLSSIHIGYTSITDTVGWALYFLAKSPHVYQKLREENMEMSKQKGEGEHLTYGDIMTLKYTNKVAEEIIRMANISGFVFRKAIDDVEYEGYVIPKGWQVILWLRYLHTNPEHFEDPMCFNPDRWDERPRFGTYLPFGGGARSCAGNMFTRVNLAIFLHYLSIGYKWELLNPNTEIKYLSHPEPADGVAVSFGKH
ncbi:hypothetical protein Cgig2_006439 [Carnegiea gigantea]|uniref:Cytochrome P450 n=1 Tax=Carnegiea gigantea TaxID=171969 RepID=A0A9Q1QEF0_9CARY|nr:hypothetical protein Cgig2_006439 [Carnegiea gigantea]